MGMIKKSENSVTQGPAPKDSGLDAAVDRLVKSMQADILKPDTTFSALTETKKEYSPRSYASDDARGKTRCVTWNAAVMSPSLAGMKWKTTEDFLKHVKRIADAGVNYSFDEKIEGI